MPPTLLSNVEKYLSVIAGHGGEIPSEPLSRVEYYLDKIVKGGGIGGKLKPEIVSALPATGETGLLYLVPSQSSGRNLCDEYFWIEDESRFELLGQTKVEVDLSGYVPNSRKVGGKDLSNDIGITISGTGAIEVADNGTSSAVAFDISHKDSGVTAGSKGDTTNQTPGFGGTFKALSATVDAKGHVTTFGDHTVKVPNATATSQADGLMSKTDKAKLDAIGVTASEPLEVTKTGETYNVALKDSGVTAGSKGDTTNQTPGFGGTFKVLSATVDAKGRLSALAEHSVEVPDTEATQSTKGLMSATDKAKLDALESENALLRELVNGIDADIYRTKSGNPATFPDGYPANVKALSVTIMPTQSGAGDPSPTNVRPISGVDFVSVARIGENANLIDRANLTPGFIERSSGAEAPSESSNWRYTGLIPVTPGETYTFGFSTGSNAYVQFAGFWYDRQKRFLSYFAPNAVWKDLYVQTFVVPESAVWFRPNFTLGYSGVTDTIRQQTLRMFIGSELLGVDRPHAVEVASVAFADSNGDPLTVYGGTLNVTTGELTITHANIDSYNGETLPGVWISDRDMYTPGTSPTTGAQVVYELATPVTYQLTSGQLATLSGYNFVSADTGTLSVTYRADTTLSLGGAT